MRRGLQPSIERDAGKQRLHETDGQEKPVSNT